MKEAVTYIISHGIVICAIAFIAIFSLERIFPKHAFSPERSKKRLFNNVIIAISYRFISAPIIIAPLMVYMIRDFPYRMHRPDWYTGALAFVIDIMLLDLLNYTIHWSAHRIPVLWRFHAMHHLDEHIDSTTGFRQHFGEKFLVLAIRIPGMLLIGVPFTTVVAFEVISFCVTTFHHCNINIPQKLENLLSKLFVMPSFHNIHHGREIEYTDTNYGFIFSLWDRVFRTHSVDERPTGFETGLDHHTDFSAAKLIFLPFGKTPVKEWTSQK
ncbi:sterol desaturase family protein [Chromobacterium sp. TRC.1.1.SA]|uniref:Sterol desaturase family protein n=1 Tax=Chromobacterium indicum TaxID=3110228 RepID=A0ABV0CNH8_9NEIS